MAPPVGEPQVRPPLTANPRGVAAGGAQPVSFSPCPAYGSEDGLVSREHVIDSACVAYRGK